MGGSPDTPGGGTAQLVTPWIPSRYKKMILKLSPCIVWTNGKKSLEFMDLNLTNVLLFLILGLLLIVHWEALVTKTRWLIDPVITVLFLLFLICFVGFLVWGAFHFGFTGYDTRGPASEKAIWFLWFACAVVVFIPILETVFAFLNGRSESFMKKQIERYRQNKEDGKNPWSWSEILNNNHDCIDGFLRLGVCDAYFVWLYPDYWDRRSSDWLHYHCSSSWRVR